MIALMPQDKHDVQPKLSYVVAQEVAVGEEVAVDQGIVEMVYLAQVWARSVM